ncbi:MAG: hypothetical protein KBA71_02340 [Opitutaceae bacterium]|nr:hypothetical protein [Opitutaceae bacterium]
MRIHCRALIKAGATLELPKGNGGQSGLDGNQLDGCAVRVLLKFIVNPGEAVEPGGLQPVLAGNEGRS